jgi:predicted SAM-dependent methyltransferase
MKKINLGCGSIYCKSKDWTNLDFVSNSEFVIPHNLLNGIPFDDETFDVVYHSHVLEHFTKNNGELFLKECFRVLKKGGIIRFAIPDLEYTIKEYLKIIELLKNDTENEILKEKYEWIILELLDQIVRKENGGEMGKFLIKKELKILDYIEKRIGNEASKYREWKLKNNKINLSSENKSNSSIEIKKSIISKIKDIIKIIIGSSNTNIEQKLDFRESGEIHQWMYDKYSAQQLLNKLGFRNIQITGAHESYISSWHQYNLDTFDGIIRKPDSIFVEAVK